MDEDDNAKFRARKVTIMRRLCTHFLTVLLRSVSSFYLSPTSSHRHPLQVENCNSNSRFVVDEDDNAKFRARKVTIMRRLCTHFLTVLLRSVSSFYFSPTSSHRHPLQVENCDSNSRLVVDENGNGKFRPKVKVTLNLSL